MRRLALVVLLLGSFAFGQNPPSKAMPVPPRHHRAANMAADQTPEFSRPDVPATAALITMPGFCPDAPAGTDPKSPACKTIVTKAEFEKLVDILSPKMPVQTRQNLAMDYGKMLVLSYEAKKHGVENSDRFKELIRFATLQLEAQELFHQIQQESKPTDAEVEKYYQDHISKYEEISVKRIFIPRNRADATGETKMPTDEDLQAEGAKIKTRLQAGEDFEKIQKEVYTAKGYNSPPPPTSVSHWRRESVNADQVSLFDLKPGEFSPVKVEAAGAYVYRIEQKQTTPLASVKAAIEGDLTNQKFRSKVEEMTSSIKPELNEAYFHADPPPAAPAEGVNAPLGAPESHQVTPMTNSSSAENPATSKQ